MVLKFCLDHPYVASTLVGMSTCAHVDANLKALKFQLTPALLAAIQKSAAPPSILSVVGAHRECRCNLM